MSFCNIPSEWKDLINELVKNSVSTAYGVFNLSGKIIYINDCMGNFLGITKGELKPQNKFINPDFDKIASFESDSELIFEGVLTIGNTIDRNYALNSKIFKRNNTYLVFAEADILHLFEENGKMSSLNQQVNNLQRQLIKEKKTLQQTLNELRETQQMLIHSEKMNALGQMIAGVAHEINNPISFVRNNLYQLDKYVNEFISAYKELEIGIENDAPEELKNFVHTIREKHEMDYLVDDFSEIIKESKSGVERVKRIVEDLRKFSRLDESEIKKIDLVENIHSVLTIVQSEISKKSIKFSFKSPDTIFIECFPGQLNQAILNILVNAIQAVKTAGEIDFIIEEYNNSVFIRIEDNGIGIKEKNLAKIFDPFFTTKPIGSGTGLGLSITYKIINDLHKGKIEVESTIDKGTKFKIAIPKAYI